MNTSHNSTCFISKSICKFIKVTQSSKGLITILLKCTCIWGHMGRHSNGGGPLQCLLYYCHLTVRYVPVKRLINALGVLYYNTDLETPAFNRDPASIRTLAWSPLSLLMSYDLFQMFPLCEFHSSVYISVYIYLFS